MAKQTKSAQKPAPASTAKKAPERPAKKAAVTAVNVPAPVQPPAPTPGKRSNREQADNKAAATALVNRALPAVEPKPAVEKKLSVRAQQLEELVKLSKSLNGRPTQRDICVNLGVTFKTAALLQSLLDELKSSKVSIQPIVNKTLTNTVTKMIEENINLHIEQLNEKLELIDRTEEALEKALELLQDVFEQQVTR